MIAALFATPQMARAHASLLEIDPANDELLTVAPAAVVLRFSEPVQLNGDSTRVLDDNARVVSAPATVNGDTLTIPLDPDLPNGTYTVSFSIVSADSHPINGLSVFHVGERTSSGLDDVETAEAGPAVRVGAAVLAGAGYLGALVATGLVVMAWRARRGLLAGELDDRAAAADTAALGALIERWERLCLRAVVLGAVCLYASVPFRIARIGGGLDALRDDALLLDQLTGPIGVAVAVSTVGLFGIGAAVERRGASAGALIAVLVACIGFALEGHSRGKSPQLLLVPADVVHVAAAGLWVGGVVGLVLALRSPVERTSAARLVGQFSSSALVAVVVVAGTGTALAWRILAPDYRGLWLTGWGLALLVKLALVGVVVLLGWYNRTRLVGRVADADDRGAELLRRIVAVEAVILVAVVGVTSVLVTRSPVVAGVPRAAATDAVTLEIDLIPAVGTATVVIDPAAVGPANITISVSDAAGPLVPVGPPQLTLSFAELALGPLSVPLVATGPGTYRGETTLAYAGEWTLAVRVRPSDFISAAGQVGVTVTE